MFARRRDLAGHSRRPEGSRRAVETSGPERAPPAPAEVGPPVRHVLDIDDLSAGEVADVLRRADRRIRINALEGRGVALYFQKPSSRTRNSAELATVQLSGHPVYILDHELGLDSRESAEDVARTLACYHAIICARVFDHALLERMAAVSPVPVVNLLSDRAHPLQALADLLTMQEEFGDLAGRTVAYVGDANNVAASLTLGAALAGMAIRIASPPGYGFDGAFAARLSAAGGEPALFDDPHEATQGADAVYTDVWTSMGQEPEAAQRRRDFAGYTVTPEVMAAAGPEAIFLHCLPAHRGEEVAAEVIDGPTSRVWAQAANRMHATRGLFWWLTGPDPFPPEMPELAMPEPEMPEKRSLGAFTGWGGRR